MSFTNTPQSPAGTEVKVLSLHGPKDLRLETRHLPPPAPGEVQVSIRSTGICGSDLHYYMLGRNGDFVLRSPLILGHEASGIVTQLGAGVVDLSVGDRVALEVGMPCRMCKLCQQGRYNLCGKLVFRSSAKVWPHVDGTLTEALNQKAELCHKLPDTVSYTLGSLIEPLAVCLHAIHRAKPQSGSSALVLGSGTIGLLMALLLSNQGITTLTIADLDESRLRIASELVGGINTVVLPQKPTAANVDARLNDAKQNAELIKSSTQDSAEVADGFDLVCECTGVEACVQTGIYAATAGGKLVLVGMGRPVQTLPIGAAALREVDIVGVFRYANAYPAAIRLAASGKLSGIEQLLVTHLTLEHGHDAFELAMRGRDDTGKPVIKVMIESGTQ